MIEERLNKCRQQFHISIRKKRNQHQLLNQQNTMKSNIKACTNFRIQTILNHFPQSIFELHDFVQNNQAQVDYIIDLLIEKRNTYFKKINFEDKNIIKTWLKIVKGTKLEQILFVENYNYILEKVIEYQCYDAFFQPLFLIQYASDFFQQKIDTIVSLVQQQLQKCLTCSLKQTVEVSYSIFVFVFHVVSVYMNNKISYEIVFFKILNPETIILLKKIVFSSPFHCSTINLNPKINCLSILNNILSVKEIDQHYVQLILEDDFLQRLKLILQFGLDQQKNISWQIIYNLLQEQISISLVLNHNFHDIAAYEIQNGTKLTKNSTLLQICSFYIEYLNFISDCDYIKIFSQNQINILQYLLKNYDDLYLVDLKSLLNWFYKVVQYSVFKYKQQNNLIIFQIQTHHLNKMIEQIEHHDDLDIKQIAQKISEYY